MTTQLMEIRTERLLLRPLRESDRAEVIEIQTDPRTNRFNPDPPSVAESEQKFDQWLTHWGEYGYGYLAAVEAGTGELLGVGGVANRRFGDEEVLNLYYRFSPGAWGKGYASEMAAAVVAWAEREVPERPVVISVSVENVPSIRVAERLGFTDYTVADYFGLLSRHYRRG
nr:GNAT family N-acetyltransferase [Amycolatopsis nigrescens]